MLKAIEVSTIMMTNPRIVSGLKIVPTPASSDPMPTMMTPGHHGLDGAGEIQPEHQFEFRDRRDQITFVHPARLVVDVQHAAADHHRDEHREHERTRQQILHVLDVGIEFDNLQRSLLENAWRNRRADSARRSGWLSSASTAELMKLSLLSTTNAIRGWFCFVNALRILGRDNDGALDFAVTHVFHRLLLVVIMDRVRRFECWRARNRTLPEFRTACGPPS